jgi:MFS family permease
MAHAVANGATPLAPSAATRTPLNRQQIVGFWAAWFGWMLDGMDSVIYALVLGPALTELLPHSSIEATPANIGYVGARMGGLFLVGWGLSFIWGPISDKFGRTKSLAATILIYALFTGAAAFSTNIWLLAIFRFLAGIGVGGEWAMAGTYVAEAWPEDRLAAVPLEPTTPIVAMQPALLAPEGQRLAGMTILSASACKNSAAIFRTRRVAVPKRSRAS